MHAMHRLRIYTTAFVLGSALFGAAAHAAPMGPEPVGNSPDLWATVNVCDTRAHPDTLGIRASMPGSGRAREEMFARFSVQYYGADRRWHRAGRRSVSDFIDLGSGSVRARQGGWTVRFSRRTARPQFLRGFVTFEWRVRGRVVRRAKVVTESGHPSSTGADPKGFSAATCRLN
jgi:hypothetical protein